MDVLDFSGEAELIDKTGNCLENGGQEVPWSTISNLENQESQQCLGLKTWESGGQWYNTWPKPKGPRTRSSKGRRWWTSLLRKEQIHPPLFFVPSRPQQIGWCSHVEVRAICFTQSTNSDANIIWKHPYRCPEIMFTSYWVFLSSVKLTHKINHYKRWGHTRGRCELHHAFTVMLGDEFRAIYCISLVAQMVKDLPAMQETGVW